MTAEHIERVFGRGRLKMTTGEHVEVFREAVAPGDRRRYTKRFLATDEADFGLWTEREWRILARLIGHGIVCVPDVVQFDGGASGGMRLVQTYDAGVTVDQWATLLPVSRDGVERHSIFDDCAHWWALAHHCLAALNEIHALQLVHLDIKGDNICIPYGPAHFDPAATGAIIYPMFARLALIDFAFSLVSGERLGTALPIGWQKDYDYQSPRLLSALEGGRRGDLRPTQELDWRCDLYSLAAMLKRYLPNEEWAGTEGREAGWTATRYDDARSLIYHLRECHDHASPDARPHQELMDVTGARMRERDLADSVVTGWTVLRDAAVVEGSTPITPLTRIAPVLRATGGSRPPAQVVPLTAPTAVIRRPRVLISPAVPPTRIAPPAARQSLRRRASVLASGIVAACALAAPSFLGDPAHPFAERVHDLVSSLRGPAPAPPEPAARSVAPAASPRETDSTPSVSSPGNVANAAATDTVSALQSPASANHSTESADTAETAAPTTPPDVPQEPAPVAAEPASVDASGASKPVRSPGTSVRAPSRPLVAGAAVAPKPAQGSRTVASKGSNRTTIARAGTKAPTTPAATLALNAMPTRYGINSSAQSAQAAGGSGTANELRTVPTSIEPVSTPVAANPAAVTSPPPAASTVTEVQRPGGSAPQPVAAASGSKEPSDAASAQVSTASDGGRRRSNAHASHGGWLGELWRQLTVFRQPAAPVEDRSAGARRSMTQAQRPAGQPAAADVVASRPAVPQLNPPAEVAQASTPQVIMSPIAAKPAPVGEALSAQSSVRFNAVAPASLVDARAPDVAAPTPGPNPRALRPAGTEVRAAEATDEELAARGKRFAIEAVPYVATQAYADASRALSVAYRARDSSQDQAIVDAVFATWPSETARVPATTVAPPRARRLHEEARKAIAYGDDVASAMDLELKAFGANPRDPDIAQFLALLHLWTKPSQPETARQLALFAIALSGPKRTARADYWNTLAVASALSARQNDATAAFLVETALSTSLDRSCRAALRAYASYGDPLRTPVQAMLYRVRSQPRGYAYPACAWPQY